MVLSLILVLLESSRDTDHSELQPIERLVQDVLQNFVFRITVRDSFITTLSLTRQSRPASRRRMRATGAEHPLNYFLRTLLCSALGQLLYLPSLGACVLAGSMLRRRSSVRTPDFTASASGGESVNLNRDSRCMVLLCGDRVEQKEVDDNRAAACSGKAKAATVTLGSPERERQQGSQTLPRRPVTTSSPCSPLSSATRAPACSSSSALLQAGKQDPKKAIRLSRVLGCTSALLPTRYTVILTVLLSWAAFFGVGTLQRCKDWNSERALFESAIKVCPDGIKTLNNMAASMLNEEEAGRAEVLLLRAVEVRLDGSLVAVVQPWVSQETGSRAPVFLRSYEGPYRMSLKKNICRRCRSVHLDRSILPSTFVG